MCDEYGANADEIWMNEDWFYTAAYVNYGDGCKAKQRMSLVNLTQWTITQSKVFMKKNIGIVIRYVWTYVYLVLTSLLQ